MIKNEPATKEGSGSPETACHGMTADEESDSDSDSDTTLQLGYFDSLCVYGIIISLYILSVMRKYLIIHIAP